MTVRFKESFARDLRAIRDKALLEHLREIIEKVEKAKSVADLTGLKKLRGGGTYYRIKVGEYRVGLSLENDTVMFVRVLHCREVYRYFP